MSLNWAKPNHNHASEYQVAGWPFVTGSVSVTGAAFRIDFSHVVQWVQVNNTGNKDLRVGFTQAGVDGTNYFLLTGASDPRACMRFDVKCKEIWVRPVSLSETAVFSVAAGLTNVTGSDFPALGASNGYIGT